MVVDFMSNRSPRQCVLQQLVLAKTLYLSTERTHVPRVAELLEVQLLSGQFVEWSLHYSKLLLICFVCLLGISVQNPD